jgi:thiamine biosynthesis protein ThiI
MQTNAILVRFAEVFLKGGRRAWFTNRLKEALERQLHTVGPFRVREMHDLLLVVHPDAAGANLPDFEVGQDLHEAVQRTFGVVAYAPCRCLPLDIEVLEAEAAVIADSHVVSASSFRVATQRSDKGFPLNSVQINQRLGGMIHMRTGVPVKLKDPEVTVHCLILRKFAALHLDYRKGPGGLPIGTSGRSLLLLSGGIDSPVAGYMMMRRGCEVDGIHFDAAPYTTRESRDKVIELARILALHEQSLRLHIVPFGSLQATLRDGAPGRQLVVLYRRFMMRIATRIAVKEGLSALVTGENLGQVASQTLENMGVIGEATLLPLLRPLLTYDKMETVDLAKRIGTYATSILPHEDCCSLFVPPHPETAARLDAIRAIEARFDIDRLVEDAVATTECVLLGEAHSPNESTEG